MQVCKFFSVSWNNWLRAAHKYESREVICWTALDKRIELGIKICYEWFVLICLGFTQYNFSLATYELCNTRFRIDFQLCDLAVLLEISRVIIFCAPWWAVSVVVLSEQVFSSSKSMLETGWDSWISPDIWSMTCVEYYGVQGLCCKQCIFYGK
jgi:hypothetical protein